MDELDRSIKMAKQLVTRARKNHDLRSESQGLSALRDFLTIRARSNVESLTGGSVQERLAIFLADGELVRAYWDWVVSKTSETPDEAIRRISMDR
jgi:hypothetical protein